MWRFHSFIHFHRHRITSICLSLWTIFQNWIVARYWAAKEPSNSMSLSYTESDVSSVIPTPISMEIICRPFGHPSGSWSTKTGSFWAFCFSSKDDACWNFQQLIYGWAWATNCRNASWNTELEHQSNRHSVMRIAQFILFITTDNSKNLQIIFTPKIKKKNGEWRILHWSKPCLLLCRAVQHSVDRQLELTVWRDFACIRYAPQPNHFACVLCVFVIDLDESDC